MAKWWIRDRWGKLTEKKELKPNVKEMLLKLDDVYEQPSKRPAETSGEPPRPEDVSGT